MRALSCEKQKQEVGEEFSHPLSLTSKLLIDEHPLQVLPSLAMKVGLNEAIILQQVHYWLNPKLNKNLFEGRYWVHNTYEQWQQQFPFWGEKTVRRAIGNLEELGVLISFVTKNFKKTKYYTIDYVNLEELQKLDHTNGDATSAVTIPPQSGQSDQIDLPKQADGSGQNDQIHQVNLTTFYNTETTPETSSFLSRLPESGQQEEEEEKKEEDYQKMLEVWNETVQARANSTRILSLSPQQLQKLQHIKNEAFGNDLAKWQSYCHQIAGNRFLMGQNNRRFKVNLDWALNPVKAKKILNGTIYDNRSEQSEYTDSKNSCLDSSVSVSETSKLTNLREKKREEILASITDSTWKEWCSQLDVSPHSRDGISLWELEEISKAWFIEVEDDKLVWIGSSDPSILSRIESLRLKLWDIIQKSFPAARTLRTRIDQA